MSGLPSTPAGSLPASAVFTEKVPPVSLERAQAVARDYYGLTASIRALGSERDQNFCLTGADGVSWLLKISHPAEDRQVTQMQTMALLHIAERNGRIPVSRVQPTLDGQRELLLDLPERRGCLIRLLSFLEGAPLHGARGGGGRQRLNLGRSLAELDLALADFDHPAIDHELLWDMTHAERLRGLLPHIQDAAGRRHAQRFLDDFVNRALPAWPRLRAQFIHNDLNPHNVLVDPLDPDRITGILDFGDMVHAPLIQDVAVGSAYQMLDAAHPLETAADFVAGYHAVSPLQEQEVDLLFSLIGTRLVMAVAITAWRAALYPENSKYILRNAPPARAALERIASLPTDKAQAYLRRTCGME
jgi:hydroxylysine kinase